MTVDSQAFSFQPPFKSPVNAGALLPTGSNSKDFLFKKFFIEREFYLNVGTG